MRIELRGADGIRLAADHHPADGATPVLLLHGGGQTRHAWGATAAALAEQGWPTTAVDLRGHGESEWSPDGVYEVARFAADLTAFAGAMAAPPVLVGASLGGIASLVALGSRPPVAAAGLVLVDIAHRIDPAGVRRIMEFMRPREEGFASVDAATDAIADYLPHRARPTGDPGHVMRNLRERDGKLQWHWDPALVSADKPLFDPRQAETHQATVEALLRSLRIPTLLVRGGLSDVITPEIADEFAALVPGGEVAVVPNAAHMVAGDSNELFTDAILRFLTDRVGDDATARASA